MCNQNGIIIDTNNEFKSFSGYNNDLKGSSIFDILEIDDLNNLIIGKEQEFNFTNNNNSKVKIKAKVSVINTSQNN